MKQITFSMRKFNCISRMHWMLSMLAIVGCLCSTASIHAHDSGLYALDSTCISCDIEGLASHGAALTIALPPAPSFSSDNPALSPPAIHIAAIRVTAPIRAPPTFS